MATPHGNFVDPVNGQTWTIRYAPGGRGHARQSYTLSGGPLHNQGFISDEDFIDIERPGERYVPHQFYRDLMQYERLNANCASPVGQSPRSPPVPVARPGSVIGRGKGRIILNGPQDWEIEQLLVDEDANPQTQKVCSECKGTKVYVGLNTTEPCRACCGGASRHPGDSVFNVEAAMRQMMKTIQFVPPTGPIDPHTGKAALDPRAGDPCFRIDYERYERRMRRQEHAD